ncbi:MAG TPA: Ig-like domain-containing protein [Myxococcaceae bacterium]|jgi:hypothetical protein
MPTFRPLYPLLGLLAVACINLPDIDDRVPEVPSADGGDGGTPVDGGSDGGPQPGPTDGGVDQTAPAVIRTWPPNGGTRVPLDSTVEVDFSEEMMPSTLRVSSVPAATFTLSSWSRELHRAVFTASAPLEQERQYTLSVEGADVAGNALLIAYNFRFTTVGPPDTTAPTLLRHEPGVSAIGAPKRGPIKLTFSEPMDKSSVEQAFSITSPAGITIGSAVWNTAGTEVAFTPTTNFSYGSYVRWWISTGAKDLEGNALPAGTGSDFTVVRTSTVTLQSPIGTHRLVSLLEPPQTKPWPVGDDSNNRLYQAFIGFYQYQIEEVCGGVPTVASAFLTWPYSEPPVDIFTSLGNFLVDPVVFNWLENNYLYSLPSVGTPLLISRQDFRSYSGQIPVTGLVIEALNNRQARYGQVQFRLKFEVATDNDNSSDALSINPDNMQLVVICEVPW